ncbi:MAG: NUDIX hydrolase [Firmicutes bacterium HGW-Firmicutes-3]|nr:MAG: NUDIX hydrolase [Firmicutes bacterium HGW-Firmicutes-3]
MMFREQISSYAPVNEQERSDKKHIYHYIEQFPYNILHRENTLAHITSSGLIMNKDLTKVLVIYHKIYQAWGWTGGHADGDEDLLKIALKEAKEETGLKSIVPLSKGIMAMDILPVWGHKKQGHYVSAHLHLNVAYVLIADELEAICANLEETDGAKWIDIEEMGHHSSEPKLIYVYEKLIKAAQAFDPKKEDIKVSKRETKKTSAYDAIKNAAIPIAIHETKSAYYKAKLVKEIVVRGGGGIKGTSSTIIRQIMKHKKK